MLDELIFGAVRALLTTLVILQKAVLGFISSSFMRLRDHRCISAHPAAAAPSSFCYLVSSSSRRLESGTSGLFNKLPNTCLSLMCLEKCQRNPPQHCIKVTAVTMLLVPLAIAPALIQYTNAKLLCLNRYLNGNVLGKTAVGICSLECSLQWEMGRSVLWRVGG